nr:MAG TPA: gamma delta Resolvase, site specific recombination [Bacteriophage sp.]
MQCKALQSTAFCDIIPISIKDKGCVFMIIGYARVSTKEQNLARQLEALTNAGCDKIYTDKLSGKDFERPDYQTMIANLTSDDVLIVLSIDRLGRDYDEIMEEWRKITKTIKADIKVLDMPLLDTTIGRTGDLTDTFIADLVLQILSYVANLEREHIRERQAEGIAIAKKEGKYKGGTKKTVDSELLDSNLILYRSGKITKSAFAKNIGVSRPTLDRILSEYAA